jgi:glucokinase
VAADAAAHVLDIVDGLVVLGGGLSGASKYIIPEMVRSMSPWLEMEIYDLTLPEGMERFLMDGSAKVRVASSGRDVIYRKEKKTGIAVTALGTENAVSIGAYTFALARLDS